jgi:hypothetical protein
LNGVALKSRPFEESRWRCQTKWEKETHWRQDP